MASDTDFGAFIEPVARQFWGEPNPARSKPKVSLAWGSNGARTLSLQKGVWFDHESREGGGTIELVMRELPATRDEALAWLEEAGFIEERRKTEPSHHTSAEPPTRDEEPDESPAEATRAVEKIVKGYDYTNRDGDSIYQVIRYHFQLPDGSWELSEQGTPKKTFKQRRKVNGEWVYNLQGVTHTIFRHPQVEQAIAEDITIFLPEGEKDVQTIEGLGLVGSTNSGGAKNWTPALAAPFKDADVIIPVDNDEVGRARGEAVALSLRGIARRIRVLDLAPHWPEMKPKQDISDWVESGGTREKLDAIVASLPDWRPAPPVSKFKAVRPHELNRPDLQYEQLITDVLDRKGIAAIAGESQGGKSFLTMHLCGCVASGLPFWEKQVLQGTVIYQAGEGEKGLAKRLTAWMQQNGVDEPDKLPLVVLPKKVNLFVDDKDADALIAESKAWEAYFNKKLRLIVIDTFNKAARGMNEISGQDVGRVLERLERISEECDCLVLFVHHLNQGGGKMRGHTSLLDDLTNLIMIKKLEISDQNGRAIRTWSLDKNKDGEVGRVKRFVLRQVILETDLEGKQVTTCVVDPPAGSDEETRAGYRLTEQERLVYQALISAAAEFGKPVPFELRLPASVTAVVETRYWRDQVRKTWSFKEVDSETEEQRQARRDVELAGVMKRVGLNLFNAGVIGKDNDKKLVWLTGKEVRGFRKHKALEPVLSAQQKADLSAMDVPF